MLSIIELGNSKSDMIADEMKSKEKNVYKNIYDNN